MRNRPTGHEACSGCGLCLLACPVWRQTRDIRLTPQGRTKALQHGAVDALAGSVSSCTLCGACEPACPENIPLVDLVLALRARHPLEKDVALAKLASAPRAGAAQRGCVLLPGDALAADPGRLDRTLSLLGAVRAADDGSDVAFAIEAGVPVPEHRYASLLEGLRNARRVIVAEGLLLRELRRRRPKKDIRGLGEALSKLRGVRARLRAGDLYVIEPRAFHSDYERLIGHYDGLRVALGCEMNLDLQRLAIPTTSGSLQHRLDAATVSAVEQARWIVEGRAFERIVVEDARDCAVFASLTERPVLHLSDL